MLDAIRNNPECKSFRLGDCFLARSPVFQGSGYLKDFRDPSAIRFLFRFNSEFH